MEGSGEARRAAAVAAVYSYLARHGGPQGGAQAGAGSPGSGAGGCSPPLWALYGRQALMNQRIRMQARRRA